MAYTALQSFKRINLPVLNAYSNLFCNPLLVQFRSNAKKPVIKGKGKGMVKEVLKGPEVCKDPARLCTYAVGVNVLKQGEDPTIKPNEEYPEWLFQLNLGPVKKLSEQESDSWEYWKRIRKEHIWRHNKLHEVKKIKRIWTKSLRARSGST